MPGSTGQIQFLNGLNQTILHNRAGTASGERAPQINLSLTDEQRSARDSQGFDPRIGQPGNVVEFGDSRQLPGRVSPPVRPTFGMDGRPHHRISVMPLDDLNVTGRHFGKRDGLPQRNTGGNAEQSDAGHFVVAAG